VKQNIKARLKKLEDKREHARCAPIISFEDSDLRGTSDEPVIRVLFVGGNAGDIPIKERH